MARILLLETDDDVIRAVTETSARLGHQVVAAQTAQRLKLELRAAETDLLIASADEAHGSGLDMVRDATAETPRPLPVLVLSQLLDAETLVRRAPVEVLIQGLLPRPPAPLELARWLSVYLPQPDSGSQQAGDAGEHSSPPSLPGGTQPLAPLRVARSLATAQRIGWTGCLRVTPEGAAVLCCWLEDGRIHSVVAAAAGALVETAEAEGLLAGRKLPDVTLHNEDEELGLLFALRAIELHQADDLKRRTQSRLLGLALRATQGEVEADPLPEPPPAPGRRSEVLAVLLSAREGGLGPQVEVWGHHESPLWTAMQGQVPSRSSGLSAADRSVVEYLYGTRSGASTYGDALAALCPAAGADPAAPAEVAARLGFLREVGYVDFVPALFDPDTAGRLQEMTDRLHGQREADHYKVLGLDRKASEKAIKEAMRQLSQLYHPDRLLGVHPRVAAKGAALYGRVQEAYEVLGTAGSRSTYREALKEAAEGAGEAGGDRDRSKVSCAQAKILMKNKQYARACDAFRDATLHDGSSFEARLMLGWSRFLADAGDDEQAFADLEQARGMGVHPGEALYYMARIRLLQKNYLAARELFGKAQGAALSGHDASGRELRLMDQRGQGQPEADEPGPPRKARGLFARLRRN